MPKSKRDKKVSLTKTKKKGLEGKHKIIEEIRSCIDKYKYLYVFSFENMRNNKLKEIRVQWKPNSRIFLGKNRLMALALGRTSAEEISENVHLVSQKLIGMRGLFFTDSSKEEVLKYFDGYSCPDYARAGNKATETVELPEGLLPQFPHSLEPQLRKLGLPTELRKGIPALLKPYTVCKLGEVLNPEQCRLLKLLENQMAEFHLTMEFMWSQDGSFEDFGRAEGVSFAQKPIIRNKKNNKSKDKSGKKVKEANDSEDEAEGSDEEMDEEEEEQTPTIKKTKKNKTEKLNKKRKVAEVDSAGEEDESDDEEMEEDEEENEN